MTEKKSENSREEQQKKPSVLEWIFAAVGLAVVAGALGFLIYRGAAKGDTPPVVKIEVESISQAGENYLVNFRVSNTGETTAADLTVEGELRNGEKSEETSDVTIGYVPSHSTRRGGLFFTKNPNEFQLEIRPKGYEKP